MRLHLEKVNITPEEITNALKSPSDFGYSGDNEKMFETWSLGPVIETRDSGLLDKSNAKALLNYLKVEHKDLEDDWTITSCSHWAVGWVNHLSFRVIEKDGTPTRMFRVVKAWFAALDDYPVADEEMYSMMESEASWTWIEEEGLRVAERHAYLLPDNWQHLVTSYWDMHDSSALESRDDQGASPSEKQFLEAFEGCEFEKEGEENAQAD